MYLKDDTERYRANKIQLMGGLREHKGTKQEGEEMEINERIDLDLNNNVKYNWRVSLLDNRKSDICFRSSSAVIPLVFPQSFGKD